MNIQPLPNNVLLQLQPKEEVSQGGIHIPQTAQETSIWGTVLACGEGIPDEIQEGDEVLISHESGTHFRLSGISFVMVDWRKLKAKR
jgi:co-chaperonin GroES (HSP10)